MIEPGEQLSLRAELNKKSIASKQWDLVAREKGALPECSGGSGLMKIMNGKLLSLTCGFFACAAGLILILSPIAPGEPVWNGPRLSEWLDP